VGSGDLVLVVGGGSNSAGGWSSTRSLSLSLAREEREQVNGREKELEEIREERRKKMKKMIVGDG
jgi:hypothetical protein